MIRKLKYGFKKKLAENRGALSIETIVGIFIALTIATALFLFRNKLVDFIKNATNKLDGDEYSLDAGNFNATP